MRSLPVRSLPSMRPRAPANRRSVCSAPRRRRLVRSVLPLLLLFMLLAVASWSMARDDGFDVRYQDNQWTGGSAHADSSGFAYSRSSYSGGTGVLRAMACNTGMGWASATSSVYKDFYYEHDHDWYNNFEIRYSVHGIMSTVEGATNNFHVKAILYYLDSNYNEHEVFQLTDLVRASHTGEVQFQERVAVFTQKLRAYWRYRIRLSLYTRCDGDDPGESAIADFYDDLEQQRYYVDLSAIRVFHTHAWARTMGGDANGPSAVCVFTPEQDDCYEADGISFVSYTDDRQVDTVVGWDMQIMDFDSASSYRIDALSIHGEACLRTSPPVPHGRIGYIRIEHRLDHSPTCDNAVGWWNPTWSCGRRGSLERTLEIMPDHDWAVLYPRFLGTGNRYEHLFIMTNSDPTDTLKISSMSFTATTDRHDTLSAAPFVGEQFDFVLPPGQSWPFPVITEGPLYGGFVYSSYRVLDAAGTSVISNAWGRHDVYPAPAGLDADRPAERGTILAGLGPNPTSRDLRLTIEMDRAAPLRMEIFDAGGRKVATLFDGVPHIGTSAITWDPLRPGGTPLANGAYFIRASSAGGTETKKVVIAR